MYAWQWPGRLIKIALYVGNIASNVVFLFIEVAGSDSREHLTTHRVLKRLFDLRSRRLVVDLRGRGMFMAEKLLKQVLRHALVSKVLRHRVTQEVRVDVLGYPCIGRDLLYKLLDAS